MALSQILGGWTKWGWPRFSLGVFLIGFLPVLVAGGWVLLARQPADWMNTSNWSRDLGVSAVVQDLGNILPAIAFGIGLVFGLSFDTAGPRRRVVEREQEVHTGAEVPRETATPVPAGYVRDRDDDRVEDAPLTADRDVHQDVHRDPPTVTVTELSSHEDDDEHTTTTRERRVEH
jgi:hypothetical protein